MLRNYICLKCTLYIIKSGNIVKIFDSVGKISYRFIEQHKK